MSKRKNGTNRAAAALGLNPYGWGNGKGRKRPRESKKVETPMSSINYEGDKEE